MGLKLEATAVSLPPDDSYPFFVTAKKYISSAFDWQGNDPASLTLILLHSTGFFKEVWEPTLEDLVDCLSTRTQTLIREAWTIECPNHGESAELNESALQLPQHRQNFTCEKYAQAVHRFLHAGLKKGAKIDFSCRNLVGIGHSLGGCTLAIVQQMQPRISFKSLILIEPMLSPGGRECLEPLRFELVRSAYERRDVWPSRERAFEALKGRGRTRLWDPRMLRLFVKYALREHPGAKFADTPYKGVTLSCTRDEEAAMYRDVEGPIRPVAYLNDACSRFQVHVIFGAIPDYISKEVHEALIDPSSPRRFASTSHVENVGHLVPQCAPKALAKLLAQILVNEKTRLPLAGPKL